MTRQWAPGDVAMIHGVVAMRFEYSHLTCPTLHKFDGDHWHRADGVWIVTGADDDARPLIVIDAADDVWLPNRLRIDAVELGGQTAISMRRIADEIEEQQRPPKPAEPTGAGAVVEDADGKRYVRSARYRGEPWDCVGEAAGGFPYSGIHAVRVLSEGVTP